MAHVANRVTTDAQKAGTLKNTQVRRFNPNCILIYEVMLYFFREARILHPRCCSSCSRAKATCRAAVAYP